MPSLKHTLSAIRTRLCTLKCAVLLSLLAGSPLALSDVILWASDNRSGQPVNAEQSEWARYLKTQMAAGPHALITPSEAGVVADYPLHLNAQPDTGALMTSRLSTGSDAALWIQLTNSGLQWVLEQDGQAQQLRTPATSDGLGLGVNWIGMQLSMARVDSANMASSMAPVTAPTSTSTSTPTAQAPTQRPNLVTEAATSTGTAIASNALSNGAPVSSTANGVATGVSSAPVAYQAPGRSQQVTGVLDLSDFLRLSAAIRGLEGIEFVYPARIDSTDVELVIGSSLPVLELQNVLAQQPWLRRTEQGDLRWDALALPLIGGSSPSASLQQPDTTNTSSLGSSQVQ